MLKADNTEFYECITTCYSMHCKEELAKRFRSSSINKSVHKIKEDIMMSGIVSFVLMAAVIEMYEHSNLHKTGAVHHNEVCDRDVRLTVMKQPR